MWMLVLVLAAFHLMRIDGTWKITGGSYTVERTGCAPKPTRAAEVITVRGACTAAPGPPSPQATATTTGGTPDELQNISVQRLSRARPFALT